MMVRAFYQAVVASNAVGETAVAPYNTITLKIYYPAKLSGSDEERNTGVVPANIALSPFPVVIIMPGINVGPEAYQWLAVELAQKGLVVVTYSWIAEEMPGYISLTPGVELAALKVGAYGSAPTSPAIAPILAEMAKQNENGRLANLLDLDKIILGGHSAGGTMALQNAHATWFPQVKGVFAYAGHTMVTTFLGYEAQTTLPLWGLPSLIVGGSLDGVIEASSHRYGNKTSATLPLERTFETGGKNTFLVILEGANHFTMAYPVDETTGRPFLDHSTTQPDELLRRELTTLILFFIDAYIRGNPKAKIALKQQLNSSNPQIAMSRMK